MTRRSGRRAAATVAVVAIAASVALGAPAAHGDSPVSSDAFRGRLIAARNLAADGMLRPEPAAMRGVRSALGLPAVVALPSGQTVSLEPDPVLEGLTGSGPGDFARAGDRLDVLIAALDAAVAAPAVSPQEIEAALQRAYRGVAASGPGLLDRLRRAMEQVMGWIADRLLHLRGVGSLIVWALAAAALAGLAWLLRRGTVPELVGDRRAAAEGAAEVDWEREFEEARRRGDLAAAVRGGYRGLVAALRAAGIVGDTPSVTAGECRRAAAARRPALASSVTRATLAFERVAYGDRDARSEDVEDVRAALREVRAA